MLRTGHWVRGTNGVSDVSATFWSLCYSLSFFDLSILGFVKSIGDNEETKK